ncbi:MAG: OmpA family protein [Woeseiaceae bacterium]|nr:OmpA family protein [Woeseiaceae bacterium]
MRTSNWTISTLATLTLSAAGLAASPAQASTASKEEAIGVGTGGIVGAIAGGPAGFIVGAAIGAKIGDTLHKKDSEIETLSTTVDASQSTIDELRADVRQLNADIDTVSLELQAERLSRPEFISLMQAGIAMDLLFRTDEHVLTDATGDRLQSLATTLAKLTDIRIELDGFADERGDADYNQSLSEKRVQYVRDRLLAAGIAPQRIHTTAHGETPATDDSIDSLALDRRVSVRLYVDATPSLLSHND